MRKHELSGALAKAGSPGALARLLGVRAETVRGWLKRGITAGGKKLLAELEERQKLTRAEEKGKRQTFDLLLKLAGERGDLKKGRSRDGVRAGPRTSGYQWVWAVGQMLTQSLIAEIDGWLLSKRRRFPLFQAVAVATEYTKQKFKGYKTVIRQVVGVEASGDFAVEEHIATKASPRLSDVRGDMAAKLEEAIDEGALVYLHELTLFNYRKRTDVERLAWEAGKRSLRKKRAARRRGPRVKPEEVEREAEQVATKKAEAKRKAAEKKAEAKRKAAEKKAKADAKKRRAVEKKAKKTWTKKKTAKATTSKKSSKQSKAKPSTPRLKAKAKAKVTPIPSRPKPSSKRAVSRAKSASTRSQTTRSSSKRGSAKASQPKTSGSRSRPTKSTKFSKKPKSFSRTSTKIQTWKTPAVMRQATKATKTTKKTSKATSSRKAKR